MGEVFIRVFKVFRLRRKRDTLLRVERCRVK